MQKGLTQSFWDKNCVLYKVLRSDGYVYKNNTMAFLWDEILMLIGTFFSCIILMLLLWKFIFDEFLWWMLFRWTLEKVLKKMHFFSSSRGRKDMEKLIIDCADKINKLFTCVCVWEKWHSRSASRWEDKREININTWVELLFLNDFLDLRNFKSHKT